MSFGQTESISRTLFFKTHSLKCLDFGKRIIIKISNCLTFHAAQGNKRRKWGNTAHKERLSLSDLDEKLLLKAAHVYSPLFSVLCMCVLASSHNSSQHRRSQGFYYLAALPYCLYIPSSSTTTTRGRPSSPLVLFQAHKKVLYLQGASAK